MKPDVVFGLENAAWPALLVNAGGEVVLSNSVAKKLFGSGLNTSTTPLTPFWSTENGGSPVDFLARWEKSPAATCFLRFRVMDGTFAGFNTAIALFNNDGTKIFSLQLLPDRNPLIPAATDTKTFTTGDIAMKHKLDCALQLARTVSLDFNNALTGVLAHTSLLLGKAEAEHPWRRSLLEVEKSAARCAEIANELAQFSRQEKETRRTPASNLNLVVGRCVEFFQNAHGNRFVWRLNLERALFLARFDEAKVQQALTKIFENAVEAFGVSGTGQITVQTRNVELTQPTQDRNVRLAAGTYVCVEIADNGSGIEAQNLPRIFEPFFTTKRSPHRGLGLALAYGFITNHSGGVAISSQAGAGTSARIYLPAENSLVQETSDGSTPKDLRGTGTVLVVDDESLVLTMAETILTDFGYTVLTANNGQKALTLLSHPNTKVSLVITDLVMPGMGGRELADRIRQLNPHLPVMPTSGYVLAEDKTLGAGYLQKPFTATELLAKVKSALHLSA